MITEAQSFAFDIRDTFFNAVSADAFFTGYTAKKNRMLPVQPDLLPYLGVYVLEETMTPDGDPNAGCIRFAHTVRIGFSVVTANNDRDAAEALSDKAYLKITAILYTDLNIMNVWTEKNVEGVTIEAIARASRRHIYGNAGQDNETPWIELQYETQAFFRSEWYPDITDTLNEIDVTTGVKAGDTSAEMANRQQVAAKYMFSITARQRRAPLAKPWLLARDQNRRSNNG
jgi:hypothetical protein